MLAPPLEGLGPRRLARSGRGVVICPAHWGSPPKELGAGAEAGVGPGDWLGAKGAWSCSPRPSSSCVSRGLAGCGEGRGHFVPPFGGVQIRSWGGAQGIGSP